jgi:ribosomal protein L11 methyltransferase
MKSRKWCQISVRIDEPYQDLLVGQLALLGISGFVQEEKFLICTLPAHKWTSMIRVKFRTTLDRFKFEFPVVDLSYTIKSIHEENWNKTWEKQTGIVKATSHIIIKPSWKKLPKQFRDKMVLHVDPKMSFGTGHHETTRLSLSLLERSLLPKMKVRLGSVSAIPRSKYDLIVANIDFLTISRFIKSIIGHSRTKGTIILSGILTSDMPALLSLFEKNLLFPVILDNENEWTAVALRRVL